MENSKKLKKTKKNSKKIPGKFKLPCGLCPKPIVTFCHLSMFVILVDSSRDKMDFPLPSLCLCDTLSQFEFLLP